MPMFKSTFRTIFMNGSTYYFVPASSLSQAVHRLEEGDLNLVVNVNRKMSIYKRN